MTTEIRISDVEMSWMFTSASARALKNVAATPGVVRMPTPTMDTLPTLSSDRVFENPMDSRAAARASRALVRSPCGTVNVMAVVSSETDWFWVMVSMLMPARATVSRT